MKVISAMFDEKRNASLKAPGDIDKILEETYKAKCINIIRKGKFKYKILFEFILAHFHRDIVVLQHPLILKERLYDLIPIERSVILIHDISGLRRQDEVLLTREIKIFKKFKYIIVHNDEMKKFLISKGISEENLYTLEIFDYLTEDIEYKKKYNSQGERKVIYPGNLKKEKSPFIYQIDEKDINFTINLYGLGIQKDINKKIIYKGSFDSSTLNGIEGDLGLIWDGNADESDENEQFKNYTKYNNPHKLSCCIAIGVPVIVWKKSAIAKFVIDNNIGYLINSIYDINLINFEDYEIKKKNVLDIRKKITNGYYTKKTFNSIIKDMNEKKN